MELLDIDDVIANLLVAESFFTIDDVAAAELDELLAIQSFDESIAEELRKRAGECVEREKARVDAEMAAFKIADDLKEFAPINAAMLLTLAQGGILTLDDLADLDSEELMELLREHGISSEAKAGEIIMEARKHWFDDSIDADDIPEASPADAESEGDGE